MKKLRSKKLVIFLSILVFFALALSGCTTEEPVEEPTEEPVEEPAPAPEGGDM